jgi:Clostridium epsilon toxin ETX/Bacillus mosquitocidal toxin MTX2
MPFAIEMTLRGVLLAGKWRAEDELNHMPTEAKRNSLIAELANHTNQPVGHFQGFDDDTLIGKGATVAFLREAGIRDDNALKNMSDSDQRNTLVVENNNHTDRPISSLQNMGNKELVQEGLGWFTNSRTIAEILEFYWNMDQAKVLGTAPEIIATETYDNSRSQIPLKTKFSFTKEITNTSTFSEQHGFEVKVGVETKFKAGIPGLAANETTVKLDASSTNTWQIGGENKTSQIYTRESDVEVPALKRMQRVASVTKGNLNVPYRAKIRAGDGSIQWLEGTWEGVSTINLLDKQVDIEG